MKRNDNTKKISYLTNEVIDRNAPLCLPETKMRKPVSHFL